MAVFLVGLDGSARGRRWPLQAGDWTVGSDPSCGLSLPPAPGVQATHARLSVSSRRIQLTPEPGAAVTVNGQVVTAETSLRPDDRIGLGSLSFGLETRSSSAAPAPATAPAAPAAPSPAPAPAVAAAHAEPLGVALPPPDPPRWRALLAVVGLVLAAAAVAAVIRLVPQRQTDPLKPMPADVKHAVQASTVWIRVQRGQDESEGSGFVSKNGYVLTNAHVIEGGSSVKVVFDSGTPSVRAVAARVLRVGHPGEADDIALLSLNTGSVKPLTLKATSSLTEGLPLAAFGFPLGLTVSTSDQGPQISIRSGTVTALRRNDQGSIQWVESDVLAEVGNSGGPVVTLDGKVIGLTTMLVGPNLRTARIVPSEVLASFAAGSVTGP